MTVPNNLATLCTVHYYKFNFWGWGNTCLLHLIAQARFWACLPLHLTFTGIYYARKENRGVKRGCALCWHWERERRFEGRSHLRVGMRLESHGRHLGAYSGCTSQYVECNLLSSAPSFCLAGAFLTLPNVYLLRTWQYICRLLTISRNFI